MKLKTQKKLAASVLKISKKRVSFDPERLEDIKEAITKTDIRGLVGDKAIKGRQIKGTSKVRVRARKVQRRKGLQKGASTRKGTKNARVNSKQVWINKIRLQRTFIKLLKDKSVITKETYTMLYSKAKGNFFRSKRHLKTYLEDNKLIVK